MFRKLHIILIILLYCIVIVFCSVLFKRNVYICVLRIKYELGDCDCLRGLAPLPVMRAGNIPKQKGGQLGSWVSGLSGQAGADIKALAKTLKERETWVRKAFEKFMVALARQLGPGPEEPIKIAYHRITDEFGSMYFLVFKRYKETGRSWLEIKVGRTIIAECVTDPFDEKSFWENLSIREIREFAANVDKVLEELTKQLRQRGEQYAKVAEKLEKVAELLA